MSNEILVRSLSPKDRAFQLVRMSSGSKNMATWFQQEIIRYLSDGYLIKSEYEEEVLKELEIINVWEL